MFRQLVDTVTDTEHRAARLEGQAGFERSNVDSVESKSIDEPSDSGDRRAVIAGCSHCKATRGAPGTPTFLELEVPKVVEALDHSRRREPILYDDARARRCCGKFLIDAVDLLPIVHSIDEDLAHKEVAWQLAEAVHRNCQDDDVGMTDDFVRSGCSSAGSQHVDNQRDSFGGSRPRYGDVVPDRNRSTSDRCAKLPSPDDSQTTVGAVDVRHWTMRRSLLPRDARRYQPKNLRAAP